MAPKSQKRHNVTTAPCRLIYCKQTFRTENLIFTTLLKISKVRKNIAILFEHLYWTKTKTKRSDKFIITHSAVALRWSLPVSGVFYMIVFLCCFIICGEYMWICKSWWCKEICLATKRKESETYRKRVKFPPASWLYCVISCGLR